MATVAILLIIGVVLLLLETILPGLIAGAAGLICLVAGVILSYSNYGLKTGNLVLFGVLAGLIVGTMLWFKYLPDSRVAKMFVTDRVVGDIGAEQPNLLHQTGTAFTQLRPSGTALINGRRVDVVTEGALIESGTPVKVVGIEGMRVVVRELEPGAASTPRS